MNDADIIVVLGDDDPLVAPETERSTTVAIASSLLGAANHDYLRSQGITDEQTWSAFRLGEVDGVTMKHFGLTGRRGFTSIGVNIPTFDPRDPTTVVGVIRLSHAQNKHGFATPPMGMACTVDVATSSCLILVDNPLLGFRLAQAGVVGVALVEDPVVLTPLAEWLAAREVVTITSAKHGELVVPSGITPIGTGRMCGLLERASSATLALVGLDHTTLRQPLTPLPLDLRAVRDLHAYAQRQVSTAAGIAALAACDLDQPDVVRAYRIGYVPADVRQAFTPDQRRMFLGRDLGGCVVFPADDEHGAVVDLVVMKAHSTHQRTTLWDAPRGLCAARLSTAFDRVVITTIPKWVGRLFREVGPTMLLRGVDDARVQAPRLAVGGVREVELRCRLNDENDQIAAILHAVGITVRVVHDPSLKREPPRRSANVAVTPAESAATTVETPSSTPEAVSPPTLPPTPLATPPPSSSPLELVQHDACSPQAIFRSGAAHYTVQIPWGGMTATQVTVSIGDQRHRDFLDLSVSAQRHRFASCAALRLGIPTAQIMDALGALLPAMKEFTPSPESSSASMETSVGVELSPAARDAAMKLVRCEQVLERIVSGVESLGWVGEPDTKALVVLAAISRLSPDPLWTVLTATTSGERFPGLGVLAAITPAEHLVHVSRLTDNALVYADPEGLRHKLLIIDDAAGLSPSVATALRILHTRGALTGTQVVRDPIRGELRTRFLETRGPVAVITATVGSISEPLQTLLLEIPVDESSAQVEQHFQERRRRLALPVNQNRTEVISALQNAQRVLVARPVVVPNAEHLDVPSIVARSRALQDAFFGLITASALLHQYQRLTMDGCVVADARDHAIALRLVLVLVSHRHADLSHRAHRLLTALRVGRHETFTVATVSRVIPEWPRSTSRRAIEDLVRADEVVALRHKIGCVREYRLVAMTVATMTADEGGGHLATPGQIGWPGVSNERAHG